MSVTKYVTLGEFERLQRDNLKHEAALAENHLTIERLNAELAAAKAQLPAEMQDCTILFKECDKGHGWLTATNWIQHPCPTCKLEAAKAELESWKNPAALTDTPATS